MRIESRHAILKRARGSNSAISNEYKFPIDKKWDIAKSKLLLVKTLGEGAFGEVVMAQARNLFQGQQTTIVAVKMLKSNFVRY